MYSDIVIYVLVLTCTLWCYVQGGITIAADATGRPSGDVWVQFGSVRKDPRNLTLSPSSSSPVTLPLTLTPFLFPCVFPSICIPLINTSLLRIQSYTQFSYSFTMGSLTPLL